MGWLLHQTSKFYNNVFFIRRLYNFGDFYWILICWFNKLSVQTFQPLILICRKVNFVYHHWSCTSIYLPLSYNFRSLYFSTIHIFWTDSKYFLLLFEWQYFADKQYIILFFPTIGVKVQQKTTQLETIKDCKYTSFLNKWVKASVSKLAN